MRKIVAFLLLITILCLSVFVTAVAVQVVNTGPPTLDGALFNTIINTTFVPVNQVVINVTEFEVAFMKVVEGSAIRIISKNAPVLDKRARSIANQQKNTGVQSATNIVLNTNLFLIMILLFGAISAVLFKRQDKTYRAIKIVSHPATG